MRSRPFIWILLCLLCLAGAWLLWRQTANTRTRPSTLPKVAAPAVTTVRSASTAPNILAAVSTNGATSAKTNPFAWRLSNTGKTIGQLVGDRHAILLENAFIDSSQPLNFSIPKNLQSPGDPGAYIVQTRGPIGNAFRALLASAGAQIVSYIPNDAYLVRAPAGVDNGLAGNPLTQAVTPYEPYYKISSSMPVTVGQKTLSFAPMETNRAAGPSLLVLAVNQAPLPAGTDLTLGLFNDGAAATVAQIEKLGGQIIARDKSPFGPVVRVQPPADWVALAVLPGVQIVEPYHPRIHANDLSRATVGVAADTQVSSNYLGLTGKNVLVEVNDSGIDATHPDLTGRVYGSPTTDTSGHGTHVAGTIAGNGTESLTVTNAQGSIMPATNGQFRGMAPGATLLSMDWNDSDQELQEAAALTNALISNNSWNYGDNAYDLAAASYDAAVRDALPLVTGSQPVLFVFSAGNSGNGSDNGANGNADSILSPATAKNVITVGALEQPRGITNLVTGYQGDTNPVAYWATMTDTASQVARYSSRGNVGVLTEGTFGRFKPDVVAPGSFVVSTRSQQWDELAYYNPTNTSFSEIDNVFLSTNAINYYRLSISANTVGVVIQIVPNELSPVPFPTNLSLFVSLNNYPNPTNPATYDFVTTDDEVSIPPDSGGNIPGIQSLRGLSFEYAVWNTNSFPVYYNVDVYVMTTNNVGDYFQVWSNLNDSIGSGPPYYYRYESGTSMSAADVSGVLALMEDYFTNTLQLTPSPALLKGMLINGSRLTGNYLFAVTNGINFDGWGLISLPNSLPAGITTNVNNATGESMLILDQSPTNALATGDSHTYLVSIPNGSDAQYRPLRVTLVWTDPPGDPAAAIKLVNNLDLVVSNTATAAVYFGNNFASSGNPPFSRAWNTNVPPNLDSINNVQNVFLPPLLGTNYAITVIGRGVNVNAVTAQTNNALGNFAPNVVQDYALVISCGEGEVTNAFTVTDSGIISNPTGDQDITFVMTTNAPLLNQIAGASPPLLGTNNLPVGTNTIWGSNGVVTLGMTNQWHFYVVTNTGPTANYTNAAFITFDSYTLAIPRMGVFADSTADATRPGADIDLYVAGPNDPNASGLTNLDPTVISNCLAGANGDAASLSRGGTEYVVYTNSAPGDVYYIGVYSEDREAAEFDFIPIFTDIAFSQPGPNGSQIVNGLNVPVNIPVAILGHPGVAYVFAIALYPMEIDRVVVTNMIWHQNFGDLIGALAHGDSSGTSQSVVLNNHDTFGNTIGSLPIVYDDSGRGDIVGSKPTDGPGSLNTFIGQQAIGPWILAEVDTTRPGTGSVQNVSLLIEPHQDLTKGLGVQVTVPPLGWFIDYVDVPAGFTNLGLFATNLAPTSVPPLQLYLNYDVQPDFLNYLEFVLLTNCVSGIYPTGLDPGNSISYGPPLLPGRYFVGLYNPDSVSHDVDLLAVLGGAVSVIEPGDYTTNGPPLLDDAVTNSTIFVSSTQQIASVNVGFVVEHPRISDLTFTLVSPTGQRILLMENRGGTTTNGAGDVFVTTNNFGPVTSSGSWQPNTNYINVGETFGQLIITYDFYTVPDEMTVYYGTSITPANLILDTGLTNNPTGPTTVTTSFGPGTSTYVTIVMNQFGNTNGMGGDAWTYTVGGVETNYNYLTFTEDTNLATIPIKFAIPPYTLTDYGTNYILSDFELATSGDYFAPTNIFDAYGGWNLVSNQVVMVGTNLVILTNRVSVVTDPANASDGSNFLALANGTISRQVPMTPGRQFSLTYMYRGPGIAGWWRGEGNATDSANPENDGNNGSLIGRFNFPAGEVGQAFQFEDAGAEFQFAGTNTYVQIRQPPFLIQVYTNSSSESNNPAVTVQSSALDVGTGSGFTIEGWINPTNACLPQPLVEWLARVPTNGSDTNLVIEAGPFLDRATGHYYYLLGSTNWTTSETWATQLGGHLATIETANEENWVYDTFANYGGTNRNLWIGLTNDALGHFGWSSGLTNVVYTNWTAGGPTNCSGNDFYTAILGQTNAFPGLWVLENNSGNDNNGVTCGVPPTNRIYGVVEVEEIQPNGVQLWISVTVTNDITSSNSCLYANLVDTTNGSHIIYSASGLVQSNVYQHVALTYSTNSGLAALYYNGMNVATTNLGVFIPKTTGDVLLGRDMSRATNNFYGGKMDEMSIYGRCLSASEIAAIYNLSALTTNRNTGKFDPGITPALSLAEAQVSLGGLTNIILGANNNWQMQSFSFIATTNSLPLQITGMEPGMLLDSFSVAEAPLGNLYYLPEQSLDSLIGTSAYGTWTLEIWDNRAGAFITNGDQLISWQLQIVLQTNSLPAVALPPQAATTITVPPGGIVCLTVNVPSWANFATNILVSATAPVDLLFNQTTPPTGSPVDYTFLTGQTSGIGNPVLSANPPSTPPLLPGQTYYLGVRNSGPHAVTAVVEVDYDIITLTNGVPLSSVLTTNVTDVERYYAFDVTSNAYEATFQLLQLSGNADLVVSKGTPLPTLTSSDYGSFNTGNADENIYVFTNSSPVALSPGLWYLGVFPRDPRPIKYAILAKELDLNATTPNIIPLTNGVPVNFTAGPGAALTNFFLFTVTNFPPAIRFELYNLSGNGDLTVQPNAPPFAPPFFQTSQQPGQSPELIFIATNSALSSLTNSALTNLNAQWYLGVPNHETNLITYTIVAVLDTNGYFPAFPGAAGAGGGAAGGGGGGAGGGHGTNGTVYHVYNLADSGPGSLRDAVSDTNRTIVFDVSGTIKLLSPLVITNSYLTLAGQTAPGGGITVAGQMTTVQFAHDVIIRDLRFRPAGVVINPAVAWSNGFEGDTNYNPTVGQYFAGGWLVDFGNVDVATNGVWGQTAFEGGWLLDLDGTTAGGISTNITTVPGQTYILHFVYARNPDSILGVMGNPPHVPQASVLINGSIVTNIAANYINTWANLNWQMVSYTFTATSSSTSLAFYSLDPPGNFSGVLLDAVSLTTNVAANMSPGDSLQFTNVMNVIADHISTSWSTNDLVSVLGSSNVTVQWSIMADSLHNTNSLHGYGSRLRYGYGALSFHHNLYANNYSANPRLGDNLSLDFVNNVIYNWGIHSGYSGTNDLVANPGGLTNQLNYACNYLIAGPDTAFYSTNAAQTNIAFWGGTTNTWIFQTNNVIDSDTNGILNGADTEWGMFTNLYTPFGRPFPLPPVPTDEAFIAYEKVLDFAGVSLFARDWVDTNIVIGVRTQTGTIISTPPSLGMVAWWKAEDNALDSVGTNNGTPVGGVTYTNGEVGQAFSFNGSSYVQVPDAPALELTNVLTIEFWVRREQFATEDYLVNKGGDWTYGTLNYGVTIPGANFPPAPNSLTFNFANGTRHSGSITDFNWHHCAVVARNGDVDPTFYIDGVQQPVVLREGAGTLNLYPASQPLQIGAQVDPISGYDYYSKVLLDELSIYNRALSASEIQAIYNAGSAGKFSTPFVPPPLDSDQDGIPDYWEITFGTDPFVASNNQLSTNANYIGYTDLEEYLGWLAAPHALTTTNTTVDVDLYRLAGDTGNLTFFVTNAVNGTVYLTNVLGSVTNTGPFSNSIAVFTPSNNYSGYASFDFFVTNNDTVAYFGPVTVSVVVSAVPVLKGGIITLTNLIPYYAANLTGTNGLDYYRYDVSTNAYGVEFEILNASSNVVLLARYGLPLPSLGNFNYSANAGFGTNALILVLTNSTPVPLTSGWWYLAVSNASGAPVNYTILASELVANTNVPPMFLTNPPDMTMDEMTTLTVTNTATDANTNLTLSYVVTISVDTNAMVANGWPLNYVGTVPAPVISNNGIITWTPSEAQGPGVYIITTTVVDNGSPPSSAQNSFTVTVNEVNTPPFWLPNVPSQTNYIIDDLSTLTVMNTATDTDIPPNPLTYQLIGPTPTNAVIDTDGVITWTPTLAQAGTTNIFITIVTDTNAFALVNQSLSATNSFVVIVTTNLAGLVCTVNWTNVHQRIDGFGASSAWETSNSWSTTLSDLFFSTNNGIIYTDTLGNTSTNNGIGLSLLRNHIIPANTPLAGDTPSTSETVIMQSAQARGANVWSTPWTPADGFKDNGGPDGGNYLGSGANATNLAYASQLANYVVSMKNQGVNLYAISVQNEPDANVTTYEACVWTGAQIHDFTTNLYNALAVAGVGSTKIMLPESQNWTDPQGLAATAMTDANVAADVGIVADHNYDGANGPATLTKNSYGKALWETEVALLTGSDSSIANGVYYGQRIYLFMTQAQANAYHYWWLISGNSTGNQGLLDNNASLTKRFSVFGQYSRFVRPGYYRIDAATTSSALISAYKDSVSPGFAIVAVNTNVTSISQTFVLANFTAGAVTPWLTTSNLSLASTNAVTVSNSAFTYTLPALSVVTFVGQGSTNIPAPLTNAVPQTNSVAAGGIAYYVVNVPTNADFATNLLLFATNGPVNVWFDTNFPPTTNVLLLPDTAYPGGTNGSVVLSAGTTPPLVPGSVYYLGVQNTNSFAVTFALEVDFHLLSGTNAAGGPISISSITATNIGGKFGFLLTWYAPTNDLFQVQWTGSLAPPITWNTFSNVVAYTGPPTPANGLFTFFDDGSQTGGFGPDRFYRLILLQSLTNGVPQTNSVSGGGGIDHFLINVPANADFATNRLLSATGPVNLLFNQTTPPTGTNAGDYTLLAGATNGISVLSTTSVPTNIVPGGTYWLGVQNTNSSAVSFSLEVDFHLLSGSVTGAITGLTITATNIGGTNGFLLQWQGPTDYQYAIQWTTNLASLVWNPVLNPVINVVVTSTNGHYSFFDNGTLTGGFGPMKFYRVLGGLNLGPITGSGSTTNTVLAGAMSQAVVTVPANAISASNLLISAAGPVNVFFNQTHPPTGNTNAGDFLMLSATSTGAFALTSNSVPPLMPGTNYYLGFQNPGASNVTFVFQVAFGFAPTNAVSSFGITATNGGIWLKWNGLTNYQYQVQWTTNLAPPTAWNTISNIVLTSTTGIFTFFDDGSLTGGFGPMKFYRLITWPFMTPIPQTLSISSVTVTNIGGTNDPVLRWSAPTNYQYGIQWTTNLALPFSNWFIIASPVLTLTNGVYTFIDNGQTGPPAGMKFFRLFDYP
jgi:glucuronoarabinoxylan endo-1,4-beta-xylanase